MKTNFIKILSLSVVTSLAFSNCTKYFNPEPKFEEYEQELEKTVKRKVLLISIDGLVGEELKKKVPTNIAELIKKGKFSYGALSDANTSDPASWATLTTGHTSSVHHIEDENYLPVASSNDSHAETNFSPSVIYRLEEMQPTLKTSIVVQDKGVGNILLMDADENVLAADDAKAKDETLALLAKENAPDLLIVQFKEVLNAGKASKFSASETQYAAAIESVDAKVGDIVKAINARPDKTYEDWLIIVTSSHGGNGNSYGGGSYPERNIFTLYAQADFLSQELNAETMEYVALNGYFPGTYNYYNSTDRPRKVDKMGVRAQSPTGAASNVFNASTLPSKSITYDYKIKLEREGFWNSNYNFTYNMILGKDADERTSSKGWNLYCGGYGTDFSYNFSNGSTSFSVPFPRGLDGAWHHYVLSYKEVTSTSTMVTVYVDGVLAASQTIAIGLTAFENQDPLTLGFTNISNTFAFPNYLLSDFRVWNRGLTESEVKTIACQKNIDSAHPLFSNLLAAYDGVSGDKWTNSRGNGMPDFTFSNTPVVNVSGNYMPCEQAKDAIFLQNIDIAPQIFYWLGLKPHETWAWQGQVFLSKFELEFLK